MKKLYELQLKYQNNENFGLDSENEDDATIDIIDKYSRVLVKRSRDKHYDPS